MPSRCAPGATANFLHQLRVGLRRMRSLLQLTATVASEAEIASLDERLVALGAVFGPARDWDVFTSAALTAIAPHLGDKERRGFARLRLRAARQRRFLVISHSTIKIPTLPRSKSRSEYDGTESSTPISPSVTSICAATVFS